MAVGGGKAQLGYQSALSVGEETAFGTYVTGTTFVEFNSESMKVEREEKKLESINTSRSFTKRVIMNESIGGTIDCDLQPAADGIMYIIKQALGGTSSNSTESATQYLHTFYGGDMESNKGTSSADDVKGLSIGVRKGDDGLNSTWELAGCRVSQLTIKGEIGEPVKISAEIIGKTASVTNSIGVVSYSDVIPLIFTNVKVDTGVTISAASTEEIFTAFELTINNNLDGDQRQLGSRNITVLPPGKRDVSLKLNQRFDTMTNYNRFVGNTKTAIEITCDSLVTVGATAGDTTYSAIIRIPAGYFNSNQPEVGGNDVLTHEVEISGIQDTTSSYDVQIDVRNGTANYW
jgi:hypothetical protein